MSAGTSELDAEIGRLTEEIAARRAEAARLREGLAAHRQALSGKAQAVKSPAAKPRPDAAPAPRPAAGTHRELRDLIGAAIPAGSKPLVLEAGYDQLAALGVPDLRVFPPSLPGNDQARAQGRTAAIAGLEALRAEGATHLVLPPERGEWLARTPGIMIHVTNRYRELVREQGWSVYSLDFDPATQGLWTRDLAEVFEEHRARHGGEFAALDWTGLGLAGRKTPGCTVFRAPDAGESLPYLPRSVEVVVVGHDASEEMLAEARRVARDAVITMTAEAEPTGRLEVEWLREPDRPLPPVSIVVPTYNGTAIIDTCLRALHETLTPALSVEVVVVDDATTDGTAALLEEWSERVSWLRVVRNPENKGFLESCNAGAEAASGEFLVFLNNDTIPLPGWLLPLVETLADTPEAGVVGGKLVYPAGNLQEAGGVIFSDGGGANFGRNDPNPDRPLYQFLREVHYCSGALLATRADLFRRLGGFDTHFSPGYYEETDYCFRVRREGARVLYEPESAIVHLEGATAGTDTASGMKRYQLVNREKFKERWSEELRHCPPPPARWDELTWHRLARAIEGSG